jgi:Fe-S-cluster containining protein
LIKHICKRCGECCIIHWGSFEPTYEDVTRWRNGERTDILKHLATNSDDLTGQSFVFVSKSCPFLRKDEGQSIYYCAINDTKPFYCRDYPDDGVCERTKEL